MEMNVNLVEVRRIVESAGFASFLTGSTSDFGAACFIIDTLLKKLNELGA